MFNILRNNKSFYFPFSFLYPNGRRFLFRGFDYLVVIDFEATCEEKNSAEYPHEIIEFPAVLIDVAGFVTFLLNSKQCYLSI